MHHSRKSFLKSSKASKTNKLEIVFGFDRILFLKVCLSGVFLLIVGRLFYLQVVEYDEYKAKASVYQDVIDSIPAKRGEIYVMSNKDDTFKNISENGVVDFNKLDKIAANIYKYNIIYNPKNISNYPKMADELLGFFGKETIASKADLENKLIALNNSEVISDKLLEILYPDLYKLKGLEVKRSSLSVQKAEVESKIAITKNKKTKQKLENDLFSINIALKTDEDTKKNLDSLKQEREKILSRITKENDSYEIIKKDIEEKDMILVKKYFQDLYYNEFYPYIENLKSTSKENQLKNFYKNFIIFEQNETRYYPDSNIFSQTTGFVKTNDKEVKNLDGSSKVVKYQQGVYGVEGYFNSDLKGIDGEVKGKYDLYGKIIATADREVKDAKDGKNIVLTIDKSIQYSICKELDDAVKLYEAEGGSILAMDPKTGAIIAMCNNPTFDANQYSKVDDVSLYNNPILSDQVEFGSVMKVITMAMGIDLGVVNAYSTYEDTGCAKIGDWKKPICNSDNVKVGAHGKTDMIDVLNKSLNLGAWYVANKVGKDNFKKYVDIFGFGQKTNITLGSEVKGDIRNLDKINNKSGDIYLATASFGQGITMTQIQYLTAFSSVINGGKLMKPYIIKGTIDSSGKYLESQPQFIRNTIKEEVSMTMRGMLVSVVERGYDKISQVEDYYVGGKTGTAQFAEAGVYGDKTTQSFVGFGPVENPKFAVLVKLKNPKTEFASLSTTPVFSKIAKYLFDYYQIPPDKKDK